MSTMKFAAKRFDNGQTVEVQIESGKIASVQPREPAGETLPWLSPGFVDLQVNGFGGQSFNDPELTVEKVERVCLAQDACGVTVFCPTAITDGFELLLHTMQIYGEACETSEAVRRRAPCFHLEGPYISPDDGPRGAHPLQHCRPPNWEEFQRWQEASGGRIKILTLSPEYDAAPVFIENAVKSGVIVSIGHTAANSEQIKAAVDAGASMSTHLGNGAHGTIRRHPNYIWDQLADDRLVAGLIADGHHLPASVVKSFVRAKTPERCFLVSDVTEMTGMPPGRYKNTGTGDVEILEDGRLVVAGQRQYLAGAVAPIGVGVFNMMRFAGVVLPAAIRMASIFPAELIGQTRPFLKVGEPADLSLFDLNDEGLKVRKTINQGETVFEA